MQAATEIFMATVADRVFNFSAGRSIAIASARKGSEGTASLAGYRLIECLKSVTAVKHSMTILDRTLASLKSLLRIGEDYEVILLQGGAGLLFYGSNEFPGQPRCCQLHPYRNLG